MLSSLKNISKFNSLYIRSIAGFATDKETLIYNKLKEALKPTTLQVEDKSSGCKL